MRTKLKIFATRRVKSHFDLTTIRHFGESQRTYAAKHFSPAHFFFFSKGFQQPEIITLKWSSTGQGGTLPKSIQAWCMKKAKQFFTFEPWIKGGSSNCRIWIIIVISIMCWCVLVVLYMQLASHHMEPAGEPATIANVPSFAPNLVA